MTSQPSELCLEHWQCFIPLSNKTLEQLTWSSSKAFLWYRACKDVVDKKIYLPTEVGPREIEWDTIIHKSKSLTVGELMNPGSGGYITMKGQRDNKWRRDSSFYNKAEYITACIKGKVSFLLLIKEKEKLSAETRSAWSQEMAFVKIWTTEWNIKVGYFDFLNFYW